MNILIDMNLSPDWASVFVRAGHTAAHWSNIGDPRATDSEILAWALENRWIVFTHDLDFGAILAATALHAPSVIQVRTQDPTPENCERLVLDALSRHANALETGALLSLDRERCRVRLLPLR